MVKFIKNFVLIPSTIIFVFWGCSENPNGPVDADTIIGKWQWVQTSGGIDGRAFTPESEGKEILLEFSADSVQHIFVDDSLLASFAFSIYGDTLVRVDSGYRQLVQIENDRLTLSDFGADGFTSIYNRNK
jgi:hypothetical protein